MSLSFFNELMTVEMIVVYYWIFLKTGKKELDAALHSMKYHKNQTSVILCGILSVLCVYKCSAVCGCCCFMA
jgi:fumarate reductase subunit D